MHNKSIPIIVTIKSLRDLSLGQSVDVSKFNPPLKFCGYSKESLSIEIPDSFPINGNRFLIELDFKHGHTHIPFEATVEIENIVDYENSSCSLVLFKMTNFDDSDWGKILKIYQQKQDHLAKLLSELKGY